MADEATEVKAEVIEREGGELAVAFTPASISADFEAMKSRLERMIEPYKDVTPEVVRAMDVKEAKACRADLKKMSKRLNDERKAIKSAYDEPLRAFEAKVKELDAMILKPCDVIDRCIKEREQMERNEREDALRQAFDDFAPALAAVVSFDRILEPQWLNKSFGARKAEDAMCAKVEGIAKDFEAFKATKDSFAFPEEAESVFWRELSLRAVHEHEARRKEQQARIDAMNAAVSGYAQEREETPGREAPQESVEKAGEAVGATFERVSTWILAVDMTDAQYASLIAWFRANDVHGYPMRTRFAGAAEAKATVMGVCNGK